MHKVFCFCDTVDDKSDHFVRNTFTVVSGIHHNTLSRRPDKFSTLGKEQINFHDALVNPYKQWFNFQISHLLLLLLWDAENKDF